jgi:hypothetical protein
MVLYTHTPILFCSLCYLLWLLEQTMTLLEKARCASDQLEVAQWLKWLWAVLLLEVEQLEAEAALLLLLLALLSEAALKAATQLLIACTVAGGAAVGGCTDAGGAAVRLH